MHSSTMTLWIYGRWLWTLKCNFMFTGIQATCKSSFMHIISVLWWWILELCMYCQYTSLLEFNTYQLKSEVVKSLKFYSEKQKTHKQFLFLISNLMSMNINTLLTIPSTKCTYYMYTPHKTLFPVIHCMTFVTCTCQWNDRFFLHFEIFHNQIFSVKIM
jgi:hypothetical protein